DLDPMRIQRLRSAHWAPDQRPASRRSADARARTRIRAGDGMAQDAARARAPALFNFTRDELAEVDFVNISYLIVHPRGALMFDTGAVPDSEFPADGSPVTEGIMSATQPLKPQLAAAGFTPSGVEHFRPPAYPPDPPRK